MRQIFIAVLLATSMPLAVMGQMPPQADEYQEMAAMRLRSRVYLEAYALPGTKDEGLLVVGFRIPNDRLVFMRHAEGLDDKLFRASVSTTIEIYQEGRVQTEKIWKGESFASEYDQTVDAKLSTVGSVTFSLPPGDYGVALRMNDLNTERSALTPMRHVNIPSFGKGAVGQAIIVDTVVNRSVVRYFTSTNLGGDARFGADFSAVVPISLDSPLDTSDVLSWSLRKLDFDATRHEMQEMRKRMRSYRPDSDGDDKRPQIEQPREIEGGVVVDSGRVSGSRFLAIGPVVDVDVNKSRVTLSEPGIDGNYYLAVVNLDGEVLENGAYVLDVTMKGQSNELTSSRRFNAYWPDMPVSLLDVDVALKNMRFILDRKALSLLRKGSKEDKINNFKTFWKERDPTPGTAYNELMTEYFRRVDYAALEYRTGPGMYPNGLETDRARIYIVHGPPDEISRTFPEAGGVRETWTYTDGKQFTFEASSSVAAFHMVEEG